MEDAPTPYQASRAEARYLACGVLIAGRRNARDQHRLEPGELVRCLRIGGNLGQRELARRAGTRQARVSRIESGRVSPRWTELQRLLAAMDLEPLLSAAARNLL